MDKNAVSPNIIINKKHHDTKRPLKKIISVDIKYNVDK